MNAVTTPPVAKQFQKRILRILETRSQRVNAYACHRSAGRHQRVGSERDDCYGPPVPQLVSCRLVLASTSILSSFLLLCITSWASPAIAQMPVCPSPDPEQPIYTACYPGGRFVVARLLSDLSIDLLLRGDSSVVAREPRSLFTSVASADTVEKNPKLLDFLGQLEPLGFRRLDTASGTFEMDASEVERSFSGELERSDTKYSVRLELPSRIEGGYWRTPGVLQMAFWKDRRVSIHVPAPDGSEIHAEIECVVMSGDGLRLTTAGPVPDILVGFDECH